MPLHSRPIPAPKTPKHVVSTANLPRAVKPEPQPEPLPSDVRPSEGRPQAEPDTAQSIPRLAESEASSRPWYRSEPWLAVIILAFVPLAATFIAPDAAQYPLIWASVIALVAGTVMLIRQGVHRPIAAARLHRE